MKKKHLVIGSTGLIGSRLLYNLDKNDFSVISLSRKELINKTNNIESIIIDFESHLKSLVLPKFDCLNICLGTTIKKAGNKEMFKKVDFDYCLCIALKSLKIGATEINLISSVGANQKSKNFYLRIKGLLVDEIIKMNYETINIYLPSLLIGTRSEKRFMEGVAQKMSFLINPLLIGKMKKYRSIKAESIALHMMKSKRKGINYFQYKDIMNGI